MTYMGEIMDGMYGRPGIGALFRGKLMNHAAYSHAL